MQRPWQGQQEPAHKSALPTHDPQCYLCPGNKRAKGQANPRYEATFVFENDYAAVRPDQPELPFTAVEEEDIANGGTPIFGQADSDR
jgi:UDPglucose--hexose-1-phosphate uridylyltransferase